MGRSLHRDPPVRRSSRPLLIAVGVLGATCIALLAVLLQRPPRPRVIPHSLPAATKPKPPEAVAALGRLEPAGDTRLLAAPITGIGGSPRITSLLVVEADRVSRGQLLARFDNGPALRAERLRLQSRIVHLQRRLSLQRRDLERFRSLLAAGAIPASEVDQKDNAYLALDGELQEARAELLKVQADLVNTELRAPFAGTVLRVHARVGERPGEKGIIELAANDLMEAVVEVYESDIDRVRRGQAVRISSENGGFSGQINGRVVRISPQVRQREVLSTDPSGDVDARIVEVRVRLDPADARRVRDLTGLKIVARLER